MKKILIVTLTLIIAFTSSFAFAAVENDANNMIADTIFLRPLGFGALIFGSTMYVISLPVALITESQDKTYKVLVREPYEYVFERPVGDLGTGL